MKIINYLKGGIGNQLFQYAFSNSLAKKFNCELLHDDSYYSCDPYGNKSIISEIDPESKYIKVRSLIDKKIYKIDDNAIKSLDQIIGLPGDADYILLDGYWQSEAYHDKNIKNLIKKLFEKKFKENECIDHDQNTDIAVHIRRKDYEHMGLCKTEYYTGIMSFMAERNSSAVFKIFTDTPNFTKHFLGLRKYKMNYINTGSDLKDLYVMSKCNYFIISNSTYSWWAAYLGECDTSEIFAPKEWVALPNVISPCPERWLLIENSIESYSLNNLNEDGFFRLADKLKAKKVI